MAGCNVRQRAALEHSSLNLFLDTEFADLEATELISLALVSEDGKHVFYAERDPLPIEATEFVREHVYPLLERGKAVLNDALFTTRLRAFISAVDEPLVIYDYPGDWRLLSWALNGFDLPRNVTMNYGSMPDIMVTLEQSSTVLEYTEAWFDTHPQAARHHALVDARALRAAWLRANRI